MAAETPELSERDRRIEEIAALDESLRWGAVSAAEYKRSRVQLNAACGIGRAP